MTIHSGIQAKTDFNVAYWAVHDVSVLDLRLYAGDVSFEKSLPSLTKMRPRDKLKHYLESACFYPYVAAMGIRIAYSTNTTTIPLSLIRLEQYKKTKDI